MKKLSADGPYVLPALEGTGRRREFIERGNQILGYYAVIATCAQRGQGHFGQLEGMGKLKERTPLRIQYGESELQLNYGLFQKMFTSAFTNLTTDVFLRVYGNFEAYFADVLQDAFVELGSVDPSRDAVEFMMRSRWPGKIDRLAPKLGVKIGKKSRDRHFTDVEMGFLGDLVSDPVVQLDRMADLRHRFVHSSGRVDEELLKRYPGLTLPIGTQINLPFGLPNEIHMFLVMWSELIDTQFAKKYNWDTASFRPEILA